MKFDPKGQFRSIKVNIIILSLKLNLVNLPQKENIMKP